MIKKQRKSQLQALYLTDHAQNFTLTSSRKPDIQCLKAQIVKIIKVTTLMINNKRCLT